MFSVVGLRNGKMAEAATLPEAVLALCKVAANLKRHGEHDSLAVLDADYNEVADAVLVV